MKKKYKSGRFRNGHTLAGNTLVNLYWHKKPIDLILPRFTNADCEELDKYKKKEWLLLKEFKEIN